jgi:hypothetical protein
MFSIYRKTVRMCSFYYTVRNYGSSLNHENIAKLSEYETWGGKEQWDPIKASQMSKAHALPFTLTSFSQLEVFKQFCTHDNVPHPNCPHSHRLDHTSIQQEYTSHCCTTSRYYGTSCYNTLAHQTHLHNHHLYHKSIPGWKEVKYYDSNDTLIISTFLLVYMS